MSSGLAVVNLVATGSELMKHCRAVFASWGEMEMDCVRMAMSSRWSVSEDSLFAMVVSEMNRHVEFVGDLLSCCRCANGGGGASCGEQTPRAEARMNR